MKWSVEWSGDTKLWKSHGSVVLVAVVKVKLNHVCASVPEPIEKRTPSLVRHKKCLLQSIPHRHAKIWILPWGTAGAPRIKS